MILKRKIYSQLLDWKQKRQGKSALLIEGARRIGKSFIAEQFAKQEWLSLASLCCLFSPLVPLLGFC